MSISTKTKAEAGVFYVMGDEELNVQFKNLLPPLAVAERDALEKSLHKYGCLAPVVIWDAPKNAKAGGLPVLVDGYNRFEICRRLGIPLKGCYLNNREVTTLEDAERWIINNQLSRRNLTDAQREEFLGRLYNAEKKDKGKNLKKGTDSPIPQNEVSGKKANSGVQDVGATVPVARPLPTDKKAADTTAKKIAKEHGVSKATVERAAKFADAVTRVEAVSPEAAAKIRADKSVLPRSEVRALAAAPEEAVKQAAKAIVEDKPIAPKPKPPAPKPAPAVTAPVPTAPAEPKIETLEEEILRLFKETQARLYRLDKLSCRTGELRVAATDEIAYLAEDLRDDANNTLVKWMGEDPIIQILDDLAHSGSVSSTLFGAIGDMVEDVVEGVTVEDLGRMIDRTKSVITNFNMLLRRAALERDKLVNANKK